MNQALRKNTKINFFLRKETKYLTVGTLMLISSKNKNIQSSDNAESILLLNPLIKDP